MNQPITCSNCGATNRVDFDKIKEGRQPVCGRCKNRLTIPARPIALTDSNFHQVVRSSSLPVLVDFWAEWCGPCHMIAPVIEKIANEMAGRLFVTKLNVDENPQTASQFSIRGIPALLIFKDGREVDRIIGAQPEHEIKRRLSAVVS
jgi:thioredoxin 2